MCVTFAEKWKTYMMKNVTVCHLIANMIKFRNRWAEHLAHMKV
jgi:hypothetical protein